MKIQILILFFSFSNLFCQQIVNSKKEIEIINIGSRLELFIDYFLIDSLHNTKLKIQEPIDKGIVLQFDKPWEGPFSGYCTVINNGEKLQLYYRGLSSTGKDGRNEENTCYAESIDGVNWIKPELGKYYKYGTNLNNIILADAAPVTHNFSPFLDSRKDVKPEHNYKALGGTEKSGLIAYVSNDGINWKKLQSDPVFLKGKFDSQNVSFWSEQEQLYVCYFRSWTKVGYNGFRSVSRTTSKDFINWSEPVEMDFGKTEREHLYTNQTSPYFRAPHIYTALAARFMPQRQVLTDEQAKLLNVNPKYFKDCSDAVFMTSRGGNKYDRIFMEGFIRPGIGLKNWVSRSNYPALNVVKTGPTEMSIYVNQDYAQPTAHLHRYALRLDGFVSVHSTYEKGELITKPFVFSGDSLFLNMSTSAAGFIRVEVLDIQGNKIEGYDLDKSKELIGNEISKHVLWNEKSDFNELKGSEIILRFVMKDADLFSMKFN